MTNRLRILATASAVTMALGIGTASAQMGYSDWDTDGTPGISQSEFGTGFDGRGVFDSWDSDGDGILSRDEYNTGYYDYYDADDSGDLDEDEWGLFEDDAGEGGLFDI